MKYWACGKLLITAEYSVLRGALALSLPTKFGQHLEVEATNGKNLSWKSIDENGKVWFEIEISNNWTFSSLKNPEAASHFICVLKEAICLNPKFNPFGYAATTKLDFNPEWGLGSSSTLISLVAQWAKVDAMALFFKTSTGSGYDVATATLNAPTLYSLKRNKAKFEAISFCPPFSESLYFVYLGKKKRSKQEVLNFNTKPVSDEFIGKITAITNGIISCTKLEEFEDLISQHEGLTSELLGYQTIKSQLFADYPNSVKSLGAWGGDFVMIASPTGDTTYFTEKGYATILPWKAMIGGESC